MLTLLHMAWRNIFRNGRRSGILIATIGVGIVGAAMADGWIRAVANDLVDLTIQSDLGHLKIHAQGYLDDPKLSRLLPDGASKSLATVSQDPDIVAYARRIHTQALATSASTSVGLYLVGHATRDLRAIGAVSDSEAVRNATVWIHRLLPDLESFNWTIEAVHQVPIPAADVAFATAMGVAWCIAFLTVAVLVFERRDFR